MKRVEPLERPPDAVVSVPGSKSYTNRALICALLAEGVSVITGALDSDDTRAMAGAIEALGAGVTWDGTTITVVGTDGKLAHEADLFVNQAGTAARFLAPVLALGRGTYRLDGDEQLRRRPMGPLIEALRSLGVDVREEGESGRLPIVVTGLGRIPGRRAPLALNMSSQFYSGLLLVAPYADEGFEIVPTTNIVSASYIRMTEDVRYAFGWPGRYRGTRYHVQPDATAASYFWAAGALFDGGRVGVRGDWRDTRQGDFEMTTHLRNMGAKEDPEQRDGVVIQGTSRLAGIPLTDLINAPDIAPTLAVVAAFADGATTVNGVAFIRHHETDRIKAVVTELNRCGIESTEHDDGFTVHGGTPKPYTTVRTYGDHRMAMSFALIGLKVGIELDDSGCVAKTFPDYFDRLEELRR